jgi:hypothetical protein
MSRFANLSKESNESKDGFQVYVRPSQRYQNRYQSRYPITPPIQKEEKIITEEKFPQLSAKVPIKKELPILNYILPILNSKEKVEVIPQEIKPEIIKEKEKLFTQEEAQNVFEKIVNNWKTYEDEYINDYGEEEYIKRYGSYLFCYRNEETEEEEFSEEEEME